MRTENNAGIGIWLNFLKPGFSDVVSAKIFETETRPRRSIFFRDETETRRDEEFTETRRDVETSSPCVPAVIFFWKEPK